LRIGFFAENNFGKFVCLGTAIAFGIQFFLNSGSALGLVPVVGLPFPFLSYGGSALLAGFFLLAVVGSIERK
jgi:rod shape determining protein RodA